MSMISNQIDELRELAGDGSMEWVAGPIRASVLREAADTIWQLRDDLQRTNAEYAELREQIHWLKRGDILHVLTDQEYIDQCERERLMQVSIDALDKENAKLRELVRDVWRLFTEHGAVNPCDLPVVDAVRDRMRELGVSDHD